MNHGKNDEILFSLIRERGVLFKTSLNFTLDHAHSSTHESSCFDSVHTSNIELTLFSRLAMLRDSHLDFLDSLEALCNLSAQLRYVARP
jgi:hypothetical protein